MQTLEDFRGNPVLLTTGYKQTIMPLILCAGMIRSGDTTGGKNMIAVVNLETGETSFMPADTVVIVKSKFIISDERGSRITLGLHATLESAQTLAEHNVSGGYDTLLYVDELATFVKRTRRATVTKTETD